MDEATARLGLPLIAPGQAQKEMTHNEALALLDLLVQPAVEAAGATQPPAAPATGQAWAVGAGPSGDWAGQAGTVAGWTAGGWRFAGPVEGATVWSRADAAPARWTGDAWVVARAAAAIADPVGGAAIDVEARAVLAAVLTALRDHGVIAG